MKIDGRVAELWNARSYASVLEADVELKLVIECAGRGDYEFRSTDLMLRSLRQGDAVSFGARGEIVKGIVKSIEDER